MFNKEPQPSWPFPPKALSPRTRATPQPQPPFGNTFDQKRVSNNKSLFFTDVYWSKKVRFFFN